MIGTHSGPFPPAPRRVYAIHAAHCAAVISRALLLAAASDDELHLSCQGNYFTPGLSLPLPRALASGAAQEENDRNV